MLVGIGEVDIDVARKKITNHSNNVFEKGR